MRRLTRSALVLTALLGLTACDPFGDSDFDRYERARAQWDRAHVVTYEMTLNVSCFCAIVGPMVVSVRDGAVVSAHRVSDGAAVDIRYVPTVDDIFDRIRDALKAKHGNIVLEFNDSLGYPARASLDPIVNAVDDEVDYTISSLTAPLE